MKKPEYTAICPTGTVPLLIDHFDADFKIWDSGAIVLYLIERYDTSNKLSFTNTKDGALAKQYLMLQMSSAYKLRISLYMFTHVSFLSLSHPEVTRCYF